MMKNLIGWVAPCFLLATLHSGNAAKAETIASDSSGGGVGYYGAFFGQSVTTDANAYDAIVFSFRDGSGNLTAVGNLYLLTQAYLGSANGLSSSTPGFLAESVSTSATQYTFDAGVTLQANTQYFFYMDGSGGGAKVGNDYTSNYKGGNGYFSITNSPNSPFSSYPNDAEFLLSGTVAPVSVPEPSSLVLISTGTVASLAFLRARRRRDS